MSSAHLFDADAVMHFLRWLHQTRLVAYFDVLAVTDRDLLDAVALRASQSLDDRSV